MKLISENNYSLKNSLIHQVKPKRSIVPLKKQKCDSCARKETFLFQSIPPGLRRLVLDDNISCSRLQFITFLNTMATFTLDHTTRSIIPNLSSKLCEFSWRLTLLRDRKLKDDLIGWSYSMHTSLRLKPAPFFRIAIVTRSKLRARGSYIVNKYPKLPIFELGTLYPHGMNECFSFHLFIPGSAVSTSNIVSKKSTEKPHYRCHRTKKPTKFHLPSSTIHKSLPSKMSFSKTSKFFATIPKLNTYFLYHHSFHSNVTKT